MAALPLKDRILNNIVANENDCWIWQNHINPNGYGHMYVGSMTDGTRRSTMAHRASYEAFNGDIPSGFHIDHLCRVRSCVNPHHLEAVTPRENVHRSNAKYKQQTARLHCPQGHEYTIANTYLSPTRIGGIARSCKKCGTIRMKKRHLEKMANR